MWKSSLSKNQVVLKKSQHMREGKSLFEKKNKKQITLVITFNWNYFPERFPHPGKYSFEITHEYWLKLKEEEIIRLCLCHTIFINFWSCMYHKLRKCLNCRSSHRRCSRKPANNCFCSSCFLLLIFFLRGFLLLLIQNLSSLQGPL